MPVDKDVQLVVARRRTPAGVPRIPKYVRFHPDDHALGLDEIFWEDPAAYAPRRSPKDGRVVHWGLYPYDPTTGHEDIAPMTIQNRQIEIQWLYGPRGPSPERQFVDALIAKKLKALQALDVKEARDYVLYIRSPYMPKLPGSAADRLWRRVRVSGGLTLSVFVDKVFTPLFGFVRNLHAHVIHDLTDGAQFGPRDCDAIDMCHIALTGYWYIPDDDWQIAHIIREKGQTMAIQYDFGDNWWFDITIEEIIPAEESTGAVVVLGGSGTHPPAEVTPWDWADLLAEADKSRAGRMKALRALFDSMNYAEQPYTSAYDLERFSAAETQRAVAAALDSPASLRSMSKHFNASLRLGDPGAGAEQTMRALFAEQNGTLRRGQAVVRSPVTDADGSAVGGVVLEEGVSASRRDNPNATACANCGSPRNLKLCSGCRKKYFCSRSCHRAAWAQGHRKVCQGSKNK